MLVNECKPRITEEGCLEYPIPGFGRAVGRITPWDRGFETFQIRHLKVIDNPLWSLEVLPQRRARALPADVGAFVSRIPAAVRESVRPFRFGQCTMLRWLAQHHAAVDLIVGHPKLLWLLTTAVRDCDVDEQEIPRLLRARQVDILARVTKSSSPAALRMLKKIELEDGSLGDARIALKTLAAPHLRRVLAHQPCISVTVLRVLQEFPDLAMPTLVRMLADEVDGAGVRPRRLALTLSDTIRDIGRMAQVLGIGNPEEAISRCCARQDLDRLHDRWVDRVNRRLHLLEEPVRGEPPHNRLLQLRRRLAQAEADSWVFPDPPLPDSVDIRAIRSGRELATEGRLQKNCVASYAEAVATSQLFVYKVLRPHRATLELRQVDGHWRLGQLKLSCNREPGPEVRERVEEWFRRGCARSPAPPTALAGENPARQQG